MADEGDVLTDLNMDPAATGNGADNQPVAGIISQYVKDLSVENPNAPACFQWQSAPNIDVQFNIAAEPVSEEVSEVELKIKLTAKADEGDLYLVELAYCGLIGMRNLPEEHAHAFLYAEAPRILFPFARRVIADATRDLGFQPMMIDPIDFNGLYLQQLQRRADEEAAAMGQAPAGEA
ncbi:Protein-export protein SecB [Tsuneonella dongtanensis]|uniref:Protein-export protein SecB n=1 Tax=Tsuneonella dongtanensis TaxID=692370 RepID=A0A1B2ABY0_9SPHN|nr:protein-export chaperone SecB [Tsuneonella dongtanensis]ANY19663.1 Protein-export protein SecB [Tsuneonella dongtanensis]